MMESFLTKFYQGERFIPEEILLPVDVDDRVVREEYLADKRGRKVAILYPQRGDKRKLVEMATENAVQSFRERYDQEQRKERVLLELQERLRLRHVPRRIECFDISNIPGTNAVGWMVRCLYGAPDKSGDQRYRSRTGDASLGGDESARMHEVLQRRLGKGRDGNDLLDLIVVDGGEGQPGSAMAALHQLGIQQVDVIGL